jgi:hypothetical protein
LHCSPPLPQKDIDAIDRERNCFRVPIRSQGTYWNSAARGAQAATFAEGYEHDRRGPSRLRSLT